MPTLVNLPPTLVVVLTPRNKGDDPCLPRSAAACELPVVLALAPASGLTTAMSPLFGYQAIPGAANREIRNHSPLEGRGLRTKATWVTGYRDYLKAMSRPHL